MIISESGKAAQILIQKLYEQPENKNLDLKYSKITDQDLSQIFPKNQNSVDTKTVLGIILSNLVQNKLIDPKYSTKFSLGSTRLAALKYYGPENIDLDQFETPEIINKASATKTSYGDLDIDLKFLGTNKEVASAINNIDPSRFAAMATSEVHIAVKFDDTRVFQIDLIDMSERADEFSLTQTSSFLDLSQNIKGLFQIGLLWSVVRVMKASSGEMVEDIVSLSDDTPNSPFAIQLNKKLKLGWTPVNTRFSLGKNGIVLVLDLEKQSKSKISKSSIPVGLDPKADYSDLNLMAKVLLQNETATKSDILHATKLSEFIAANYSNEDIQKIWNTFLDLSSKRFTIDEKEFNQGASVLKNIMFSNKKINEVRIISEGGVGGHLQHIHENPDLTFYQIKRILTSAAQGKLVATEKTDGANIFLSWKNNKALAARNKSDLKKGGMSLKDLIAREFKGGDEVKNTYIRAFKAYETAIKKLNPKIRDKIFGGDEYVWFNAEIMGPAFANTVNYDKNIITIHKFGHKKFNPNTDEIYELEDPDFVELLNSVIDGEEEQEQQTDFPLKKAAIAQLRDLSDGYDLNIAKTRINKAISNVGLKDNNTIADYLLAVIKPHVEEQFPEISNEIKELIAGNVVGLRKLTGPTGLPKGTPKEFRSRISAFKKQSKQLIKQAIFPIEDAIHDFAVELLKGVQSVYIVDNKKEVERLKQELATAIKVIRSSNNENALEILSQQLEKIKNHENITTAVEGVVFEWGGQLYKFTGNFAPVNRLLGLLKYGAGKAIPPLKETSSNLENQVGNSYVVIPGGFKPPHKNHYNGAKWASQQPGVDKVVVLISPKERAGHSVDKRIIITAQMSLRLWKLYTKNDPNIIVQIANEPSPVMSGFGFLYKVKPGDTVYFAIGSKEEDGGDAKRFNSAQKYADKKGLNLTVKTLVIPLEVGGGGKISGTYMRELIANEEEKAFKKALPDHLNPTEKELAWDIINREQEAAEIVNEVETLLEDYQDKVKKKHTKLKKRVIATGEQDPGDAYPKKPEYKRSKSAPVGFGGALEEEIIDEISAMATGAVEGAPGLCRNKKPTLFRETEKNIAREEIQKMSSKLKAEPIRTREQFVEELKLREYIRKAIGIIKERREIKQLNEFRLRSLVRKLITEAKVEDAVPHQSTGINILETLLKKIIPIVEEAYKQLTTDKVQRVSYRAHIIKAVQNTIAPQRITAAEFEDDAALVDIVPGEDVGKDIGELEETDEDPNDEDSLRIDKDEINRKTADKLQTINEIEIEVGDEADDNDKVGVDVDGDGDLDKFIDIEEPTTQKKDTGSKALSAFTIPGEDMTGRNVALQTFQKIEQNIIDSYSLLRNEEDIELFYDYLITNLKLYFDRFEDELTKAAVEPTTDEYEKITQSLEDEKEAGEEADNLEDLDQI